jgi:hypothetical protein
MSCELSKKIEALEKEIEHLRAENETLKGNKRVSKPKIIKVRCPFVTAKGTQCMKFCMEGCEACKVHLRPVKEPKKLKPSRVKKVCCTGINIRGNPCKRACIQDQTHCERHDPDAPTPASKVKRNKKRDIPKHNHSPSETPTEPCTLCDTHGNIFNENQCVVITETLGSDGSTLRDRIKNIHEI